MYPQIGVTKEALAHYYAAIGAWMVPHIEGRPLTLVRCPAGAEAPCAYVRHAYTGEGAALRRVSIPEKTKTGEYLVADSIEALVSLVQMDVLEVHTWNARIEQLEKPDRIVFDLDPGPAVPWSRVTHAAQLVRDVLARLDLTSYPKTTGGKGLHVVVPLEPRAGWDDCLAFGRAVARFVERLDPSRFTASMVKSVRRGRIYIDYLRNHRAASSIAVFSARARPLAPVSLPLAWEEVTPELKSDAFTVTNIAERMRGPGSRAWTGYDANRQRLRASMLRTLER